jgi:hypothetical protein
MDDELKTILEIGGDSTGAEKAIDRTIAKVHELPAAAGQLLPNLLPCLRERVLPRPPVVSNPHFAR